MPRIAPSLLLAVIAGLPAPAAAEDPKLGLVVQNNIAAMVVDMNPSYANVKIEGSDGALADRAMSRYRSGTVKALLPLSGTSNLGQQGGAAASAPQPGASR
ncbi:MAG: hypothetical protein WCO11_07940 [Sphingomonadales bacterium]|jgi:type IV pilus biogenesis protein CpaD/CtpE